jgi:hypothetical protein
MEYHAMHPSGHVRYDQTWLPDTRREFRRPTVFADYSIFPDEERDPVASLGCGVDFLNSDVHIPVRKTHAYECTVRVRSPVEVPIQCLDSIEHDLTTDSKIRDCFTPSGAKGKRT